MPALLISCPLSIGSVLSSEDQSGPDRSPLRADDATFLQDNATNHLTLAAYNVVKISALCHLFDYG